MATDSAGILVLVIDELEEGVEEVGSAVEWAQVRVMAADGLSQTEIAVRRLVEAAARPRYCRAPAGSMLDPLEAVMVWLLAEWPQIKALRVAEVLREDYGYVGAGVAGRLGGDAHAAADRWARAAGLRAGLLVAVLGRVDGALQL